MVRNRILNLAAGVRKYLFVMVLFASGCLGIGFAVSKAQTETPETSYAEGIHESEHNGLSEHPTAESRPEAGTGTLQEELSQPLLAMTATTSIAGQISTTEGISISHGRMTLIEADGSSKIAASDSFGNFRFEEIPTGQQVTIRSVNNSQYLCAPITLQLTGTSAANFKCTQVYNAKAAKTPPLSPPTCVDTEITGRNRPPLDSDQRALAPIAEHQDCRSSGSR